MTLLADLIEVKHRSVRAVNLEEDLRDPEVLRGYVLGEHVVDALRRIAISLQEGPRSRAWSITGPYGSGKSSFAHLLCSLLGAKGEPAHRSAVKLLRESDTQLADTFSRERRRLGITQRGLITSIVTAEREPVPVALLRALNRGADLYWNRGRKPDLVHELRALATERVCDPDLVLSTFDKLTESAPVLVIVDELGKNLEYTAEHSGSDLYLLQQLAERVSSRGDFAGGLLTLAHLGFEDYLATSGDARRREWRKVHGRFEDIPFLANTAHSLALLDEALDFRGSSAQKRVVAKASEEASSALLSAAGASSSAGLITNPAQTYPLHPAVALALPALAAQLGQHDRSLVAYLTSDSPNALPNFLVANEVNGKVPFVRLDDLYDYFFADQAIEMLTGSEGDRAREIRGRIDDAHGIEVVELQVLKTVGILNLLGGADRLIASGPVVEEAIVGPSGSTKARKGVREVLQRLHERSLLTYRDFAGEYRVWEGSDFDTRGQLAAARENLSGIGDPELLEIISEARTLRAAVARRHSQQHHVLRYFECRYSRRAPDGKVEASSEDADGLILYVLATRPAPKSLPAATSDGRPLVTLWSPYGREVDEAAINFAAARSVLVEAPELERDSVAKRELRHRVTALQGKLTERIDEALEPSRKGLYWFANGKRRRARGTAEFSRLLSELCDQRFPKTPIVRNEMLNRRELTSQGAKARREILERIFTHDREPGLGIDGYGPERAMYEAVLHHTGLHSERDEAWSFGEPPKSSDLYGVWRQVMDVLDAATDEPLGVNELYQALTDPPFGMKVGALPVLLAAAFQYRAEDIFLYQDGSFQPVIDAAHIERMLKTPERFSVKRVSLAGVRAGVFEQLRKSLSSSEEPQTRRLIRNETTLAVVRPLIAFGNALPEYTRQTEETSGTARAVCTALLEAREPDSLLFDDLPTACGVRPFSPDSKASKKAVTEYVERLRSALAELGSEYARLLEKIGNLFHDGFACAGPRSALREELRSRSRPLLRQVIEPKMRAFLSMASEETLEDQDWLEALAMTLVSKPPESWTDHDVGLFEALIAERAQWFRRLELLYHELNGKKSEGFEARRVTLTEPDGNETAELVRVDLSTQELVGDVLDKALAELEERLGKEASEALLGVLAGRVLSSSSATTEDVPAPQRKAKKA
jgi:hypothetical protein